MYSLLARLYTYNLLQNIHMCITKTIPGALYVLRPGSAAMIFSQVIIVLWMLYAELIAYELFTPLNLSLIEDSVSLRCQSYRLRAARGPLEEAVLCTSEEECRGLWLPEEQTSLESCVCEEVPGANFTPVYKLPFIQIKSVTTASVRGNQWN